MTSTTRRRLGRVAITATAVLATCAGIGASTLSLAAAEPEGPPAPVADSYTALEGRLQVDAPGLLANDTGAVLQVTDIRPVTPPPDYSLSWQPNGGFELTFSPLAGEYSFEYTVTSASGLTATAPIYVAVAPSAPTCPGTIEANDDAYSTPAGTPLDVSAPGVLANDLITSPAEVSWPVDPIYGELQLNPDGSFTYTPPDNFIGVDKFAYTLLRPLPQGQCPDQALVTVTVEPGA